MSGGLDSLGERSWARWQRPGTLRVMRRTTAALLPVLILVGCAAEVGAPEVDPELGPSLPAVGRVMVHHERDLRGRGCDVWAAAGLDVHCRWAAFQLCRDLGFGGAVGAVDVPLVTRDGAIWLEPATALTVACLRSDVVAYREYPYSGGCTFATRESVQCEHLARASCLDEGFVGTVGVVGFNTSNIATLCLVGHPDLGHSLHTEPAVSLAAAEPKARSYWNGRCSEAHARDDNGCAHHADLRCLAVGATAGTDVLELSAGGDATYACLTDHTGRPAPQRVRPNALGFYDGSLQIGINRVGGPAFWARNEPTTAGGQVWADGMLNELGMPVLIRSAQAATNYTGPGFSRDQCLDLAFMAPWQDELTGDGEVNCTYSQEAGDPIFAMGDRAMILYPGERLGYVGVAQWEAQSPAGLHAWMDVTVSPLEPGIMPVRRLRFPRRDSAYELTPGVPLTIPAGCVTGCPLPPPLPAFGIPERHSNHFYRICSATTLGGLSWFISSPESTGAKVATTCIRIHADAGGVPGAPVVPPICHTFTATRLGPTMFLDADGRPNSFRRLAVPVPAGSWIGVDLTMQVEHAAASPPTFMDLGAYLWLDDTNRDIGRVPPGVDCTAQAPRERGRRPTPASATVRQERGVEKIR